jgi:signal transduction histidine kinase
MIRTPKIRGRIALATAAMVVLCGASTAIIVPAVAQHWLRARTGEALRQLPRNTPTGPPGAAKPPLPPGPGPISGQAGGSNPAASPQAGPAVGPVGGQPGGGAPGGGAPGGGAPGGGAPGGGPPPEISPGVPSGVDGAQIAATTMRDVRLLGFLLTGLLAGLGSVLSWIIAGRIVRPMRQTTATARSISRSHDLGRRINLAGPNDEVKELADTLDGMFARLDQSFAAQQTFVSNASHELRTPISVMKTVVDVALDDPEPSVADLRGALQDIDRSLGRSTALVHSLLALSQAEQLVSPEQLDLDQIVAQVVADSPHGLERFRLQLAPAPIEGDAALIERLVNNLIDNAARHGAEAEPIVVTTMTEGDRCRLSVENDGSPVDSTMMPMLFDRFWRRHRTGEGFGIGLSIVQSIAHGHHGEVEARPRVGGGLIVDVYLPTFASAASPDA